ncbi:hypothetical protein HMPREF1624_02016 [Sporothrix schenckii ATCC 58251]|uniref:Uncharacterized protein n=1 Tax=Sporothrix schenckii (strain ATCC 58251 / de Perez 2211183) TaxID=1391915 RepID=U7PYU8_SPOS1|nr:hypothetical protein HMPREF1624_02016 [Sporothrix schenckii ATCC 58251]
MARPKSKSGTKSVEESVTVATDATPSPPTTRKRAAAEAASATDVSPKSTRKGGRSKNKPRASHDDGNDSAEDKDLGTIVVEGAEKARGKAATAARSPKKAAASTKKERDKSLRKARKVVDEVADTFNASPHWPLPGVLSQAVQDKGRALRGIVFIAVSSSLLASGGRLALRWLATAWSQTWISEASYFSTAGPTHIQPFAASVAARILRLAASWGSAGNLSALQALSSAPIIYLLNSYYNVPFVSAFLAEAVTIGAETIMLEVYEGFAGSNELEEEDFGEVLTDMFRDITAFTAPYAFAAVIYGFVLVQACRFFLPATLVIHFLGIATVEPARVPTLLSISPPPSLYQVFSAVFLSFSAVVVNTVSGFFSRNFIFNVASSGPNNSAASYRRTVALRAVTTSLSVGANIFVQCLHGIPGVDAVGAAAFASIWAVAPLFVAVGLGYTGL